LVAVAQATKESAAIALGFKSNAFNGSVSISDMIWHLLTQMADVTGQDAVKPLMPGKDLRINFRMTEMPARVEVFVPFSFPRGFELVRLDYQRQKTADLARGSDHYKRILDAYCIKYQTDPDGLGLPGEERLPRQTTIGDTFVDTGGVDLVDHTASGPNGGFSWTITQSETPPDIEIRSGGTDASDEGGECRARAESDLSSDDHYAEADVTLSVSSSRAGTVARFEGAADTGYTVNFENRDPAHKISKWVTGTETELSSNNTNPPSQGDTIRLEVNGSDLEGFVEGVSRITVTDTSLTGQTRTGLFARTFGGGERAIWGNFEAADLAAPEGGEFVSATEVGRRLVVLAY
jgi:hypothetical protein